MDNSASPVRNVRFAPELLNRSQLTIANTAGNYYFTQNNKKKLLGAVYTKQVLVTFRSDLNAAAQQEVLNNLGFVKALVRPAGSGSEIVYALELMDGLNPVQVEQALLELQKRPEITYAAPYFLAGKQLMGVSNELKVQLNNKEQRKEFEQLLHSVNATVQQQLDEQTFVVQVDKNSKGNALALANFLSTQHTIATAEPTFLTSAL
ncbi:hypothetical protein [Botryobacter ruber]|uniref:hypothetical protein n=1 Tax=Botryobacter ruber TaxID=2171629 RepID=UPI000FEC629A|nr:hypothetical protein [Botryobacter ruber]